MKKSFSLICAALAASATILSCVKENAENVTVGGSQENHDPAQEITISATLSDLMTKVGFAPSYDSNGKPTEMDLTWSEGDQLRVYNHDDRTKFDNFVLDAASAGSNKGIFTGTPANLAGATKFDVEVVGAEGFSYSAQTQPADGVTSGLKYMASATGLADYSAVTFTEFSSVLAITAKMPDGVAAKVQSVEVKASEKIFDGADRLTVTFAQAGDAGEDGILNIYATLPQGTTAIPAGTTLVAHFNAPGEAHDVYTRFVELGSGLSFAENKLNTININAANCAAYANASAENIGTETNPYLVGDKYQFDAIRTELSSTMAYFEMVDDIDLTGVAWKPLNTTPANCFSFDGNNYILSNITSAGSTSYQSVFGCLSGTIKNLKVDKATMVAGSAHSGVLCSHLGASGSTVKSIVSNVTITNSTLGDAANKGSKKFGILAGALENPNGAEISDVTISDCSVASSDYTGGMIAITSQPFTISGTNKVIRTDVWGSLVGGVVGYANSDFTMSGCTYVGGTVTASGMNVGGMVASTAKTAVITDCHVQDAVIDASAVTSEARAGGFIGRLEKTATVKGCTVGTETKKVTVKFGTPANSDTRVNGGGFVGLAYGSITKDGDARCKAYVKVECTNTTTGQQLNIGGFAGYHQYNNIEYADADVDMTGLAGTYVGGFCGVNVSGDVTHCSVTGTVTGSNYTGGFMGVADSGTVSHCTASGSVTTAAATVGGFLGGTASVKASYTMSHNTCSVNVTGTNNVGGFVGTAACTYISNVATGTVTSTKGSVGGFAGRTLEKSNAVFSKNCATGDVYANNGSGNVGGLLGYIGGNLTMSDCYATGKVGKSGSLSQKSGGLVGYTLDNATNIPDGITITNCYASGEVQGSFASGGFLGRMGLATVNISNCVAWSDNVVAGSTGEGNWSTGAVVGVVYPGSTVTNCYRKPGMQLTAYWVPEMSTFQHADVTPEHPLTDKNGVEMEDTKTASGQAHYPIYPYHGKLEAGKTLSALARDVLGWSADVWDFSGELPTLK